MGQKFLISVKFDDQIFISQSRGGISTYFAQLIREFAANDDLGVRIDGLPFLAKTTMLTQNGQARRLAFKFLERRRVLKTINAAMSLRDKATDIVHSTYYDTADLVRGPRRVVTVHDMTPELFPQLFPSGNPHKNKDRHVRQADLILCVSETTRNDLFSFYPEIKVPVLVTPLAVGWPFSESRMDRGTPEKPPLERQPFVLFVGSRSAYKGFDVFLSALQEVRKTVELGLVIVGGGSLSSPEMSRITELGLGSGFSHVVPSDEQLRDLYQDAALFVFPSQYEGFGLPVLEAMACGCPVVVSDAPALVEVAGGGAAIFERGDVLELAKSMIAIVDGLEGAADRRQIGLDRSASFSWRNTALQTSNAYKAILAQ